MFHLTADSARTALRPFLYTCSDTQLALCVQFVDQGVTVHPVDHAGLLQALSGRRGAEHTVHTGLLQNLSGTGHSSQQFTDHSIFANLRHIKYLLIKFCLWLLYTHSYLFARIKSEIQNLKTQILNINSINFKSINEHSKENNNKFSDSLIVKEGESKMICDWINPSKNINIKVELLYRFSRDGDNPEFSINIVIIKVLLLYLLK